MELYINLLSKYKTNPLRVALGVAMLGLSAYTIMYPSQIDDRINTYVPVFIGAGILYIIIGFGISPISIFAKAYISINKESIEVKKNIVSKAWTLQWTDIKQIQLKVASIRFTSDDITVLEYNHMSEENILELKTAIIGIAKEKNISLS